MFAPVLTTLCASVNQMHVPEYSPVGLPMLAVQLQLCIAL